MNSDKLQELITRVRRVGPSKPAKSEAPALPPGMARAIVRRHQPGPSRELLRIQTWTYSALGVATAIALSLLLFQPSSEPVPLDPTDPWMEMPMTDLIH